jgi:hypothetical protein
MWPDLMGPGWEWQVLMAVGLMCGVVATLRALAVAANRQEEREGPDLLLSLWHRYEEGDLTRREFDRLRRLALSGLEGEASTQDRSAGPLALPDRASSALRSRS